tara:strand:- start:68 stop:925 length:858 start_codon:yes stop_codon:yes gene_type:complete
MKYTSEYLQMQKLAGIITEGEYREKVEESANSNLELKSLAKKLYLGFKKMGAKVQMTDENAAKRIGTKTSGNMDEADVFIYVSGEDSVSLELVGEKAMGFKDKIKNDFKEFVFNDHQDGKTWDGKTTKHFKITPGKTTSENLKEEANTDLELKSFTKQLYSYAKKEGAQAFLVDYSKQDDKKTLGTHVKDNTKPSVFISIGEGKAAVRMIGAGVDQLYKAMVNQFTKFEFGEYSYNDKRPFPPYKGMIPIASFTVKSKTTGKKGGVVATESLKSKIKNMIRESLK